MPLRPVRNPEFWVWGPAAVLILLAYGVIMRNGAWFWPGMAGLMLLLGIWSLVAGRGHHHPALRLTLRDTALGGVAGVALYAAAWGVHATVGVVVPELTSGLAVVLKWATAYPVWMQLLSIVLIAFGEELFWRRLLLDRLYHWGLKSWWKSLAASTVLYSAVHLLTGSLWLALAALAFGFVWGAIALWTRNSWTAIVCHLVYDVLMFIWLKLPGY
jgi:membrane protease YdiL (CAAX protease family)